MQNILLTGLNHNDAPLEVRERVSFSKEKLPEALALLGEYVRYGIILSTCNRTEVYAVTKDPENTAQRIRQFLAEFHAVAPEAVNPYLYDQIDENAVHHLFRVSAGLDSMIVGESQILGQIREALSAASETATVRTPMAGLFHTSLRVGRRVREETEIGHNALSISYAGVQLAKRYLGDLQSARVLLVGAGDTGQLVAKALRTVGVGELIIANRTESRAKELALNLGGATIPLDGIADALSRVDVVILATNSPDVIITYEMLASSRFYGDARPLFIFDLAVPRDVDPDVGTIEGVQLLNIDDLECIAEENLAERKRATVCAEELVKNELARFMTWWNSLNAVPAIKSLHQQAEQIRSREVERAMKKIVGVSHQNLEVVEALTRSIVAKILHEPTMLLKRSVYQERIQAAGDPRHVGDES